MTEADLVLILSELSNRYWTLQSWFVSVSMALFTLAYFIGKRLSLVQVVFIVIGYLSYFYTFVSNLGRLMVSMIAGSEDLRSMEREGIELSQITVQVMDNYAISDVTYFWERILGLFSIVYILVLIVGLIGYLIFQYRAGKHPANDT